MKRWILRAVLVLALVALGILMAAVGEGHTVLLDDKAVLIGSVEHAALKSAAVSVDGKKPLELSRNERDKVQVMGRRHRVRVEILSGPGAGTTVEKSFTLGKERMWIIRLPALAAGEEKGWLEPFQAERRTADVSERIQTNAEGSTLTEGSDGSAADAAPVQASP